MVADTCKEVFKKSEKLSLKSPVNTPNYMLFLETQIVPLYLETLKIHFDYIRNVITMPESRLPHILAKVTFSERTFWVNKWLILYNSSNINMPLNLCSGSLSDDHLAILDNVLYDYTMKCIAAARSSLNHDLYRVLDYNIKPHCFDQQPLHLISVLFKARGGMLQLNSNSFIQNSTNICTICNLNEVEDTFHVIGVCPIYRGMRQFYLGRLQLSLSEVIDLLNSQNPQPLYEFLTRCLKYRKLILNEFGN